MERGGLAWDAAAPSTPDARRALGIITQTLAADPADIMANHLCIHAYDQAPDRAPALHCAQALDDVRWPPQAEHLAHMPAHYWIETGDYSKALASSQRALDLIETLQTMPDQTVDREHYVKHDAYVGYSAAMMLGNYATAQMWAKRMDAAFGNSYDGVTALRFNRFDQAFDLASGSTPTDLAVRGYAAVALNRLDAARSAAAELNKATVKGYIGDLFLARLAEHDERFDEASRWIDTAIAEQHASLGGELIPLIPALEAPGGLALRRGRYAEAADDFRACLAAFPNDPRALFGLATALRASNQPQDPAMAAFDAEWNGADTALVPDDL
jgi:tetratricopeptide (TPR) repeat protein